ncbi:MAG TPA: hypothetical protein VGR91_18360 [Stellaceae bacterium]|nr:hypothetical protein [Stellaceae bacterium]
MRRLISSFVLFLLLAPPAAASGILTVWQGTHWGETSRELRHEFGARATPLPWRLDFGDAYTDVVLRREAVGGVPVIVFFQMEKRTGGLKRIQIERPRHGVNPPALRDILAALEAAYGEVDRRCLMPPRAANGYQAAVRWSWLREGALVRAIFRDTTPEAVEGCIGRPLPCGLTGQLLVRISPARGTSAPACGDLTKSRGGAIRR